MKSIKKFLTLGFALIMVLALVVGCTKPAEPTEGPSTEVVDEPATGTITLAGSTTVQPWLKNLPKLIWLNTLASASTFRAAAQALA